MPPFRGQAAQPRLWTRALAALLLAPLLLGGCVSHVGPKSIPADRFDYSGALSRSWKEQMVLNLVKIRYSEPPMFLDVQQVVQQYTLEGSGTIYAPGWTGNSTITQAANASARWAESPTITYTPLSGEKFTKSLLQPVSPTDLFSLVQAGWPVDAVFAVAVRSICGLHAGSRTEALRHEADNDFYRVLALLRELQRSDSIGVRVEKKPDGESSVLVFRAPDATEAAMANAKEVRKLLHLNPDATEFRITFGGIPQNDKELAMLTRSMLEILAEASAGVEVPPTDLDEGRALRLTRPADANGPRFEHSPEFNVHVHYSLEKPAGNDVFAAIPYRGGWFFVDDRDFTSKRGLAFLMMLFTLLESGASPAPPALTISKP